ncbi:MAG: hypothetical protein ACP59X_07120 [Solidesulfovibrio sp. DCME]|uniref:hypothetical protein n=1 Tax=Solidesulfovibrio sp. DCME TaxID=3447380 RepID=UPI003D0CD830
MTLLFDDTKKLEKALGPEAAGPVIEVINDLDARVLAELRTEVATKADFFQFETKLEKRFGDIDTRFARLEGKIDRMEMQIRILIGLAALAIAFFSPVAEKLLALIK